MSSYLMSCAVPPFVTLLVETGSSPWHSHADLDPLLLKRSCAQASLVNSLSLVGAEYLRSRKISCHGSFHPYVYTQKLLSMVLESFQREHAPMQSAVLDGHQIP